MAALDRIRRFVGLPNLTTPTVAASTERGSAGAQWWSDEGWDMETHPDLQGANRYHEYDRMVAGDPKVSLMLEAMTTPIRRAGWAVEPASPDPVDQAIADMVAWNLGVGDHAGHMVGGWDDTLARMLLALTYGHMYHETVWGQPVEWRDADGDAHLIRPVRKVSPRWPHTIIRRVPDDGEPSGIRLIEQENTGDIPGEVLLVNRVRHHASPITGLSVLRPAYTYWRMKKGAVTTAAIGFDRFANPLVKVRHPAGTAHATRAKEIGRSVRAHEAGFVALPGPPPTEQLEGWDVTFEGAAGALVDPNPFVQLLDDQILSSGMVSFFGIGLQQRGSSEFGGTLADLFQMSLDAVAGGIATEVRQQVIARIVRENFGPQFAVPRLTAAPVSDLALEVLGRLVGDMSAAGMNVADLATQNHIRMRARLPVLEPGQERPEGSTATQLPLFGPDDGPPGAGE